MHGARRSRRTSRLGGIIGPQLFAPLVATGKTSEVFKALAIGAVLMIVGGLAEIVFGVKAERKRLERIATPLTAVRSAVQDTDHTTVIHACRRVATRLAASHDAYADIDALTTVLRASRLPN
ncbi:MAG TPA: hypothetical protein VGI27_02585 [Solirubrobacteraceae bacterium]